MHIDFNRICKLAGVASPAGQRRLDEGQGSYFEGEEESADEMMQYEAEEDESNEGHYGMHEAEEDESNEGHHGEIAEEDADEMVDVDINELMSEIRRAKKLLAVNEHKKLEIANRKRKIQENHLKRIIQKEVENVLSEIEDHDSSWVYGSKKPRHSREGYTNQGRQLPGIGFNKKW